MIITQGSRGDSVKSLQSKLNLLGEHLQADGVYGAKTAQAVRRFQASRGLGIDGIVGLRTGKAIDDAVKIHNPFASESVAKKVSEPEPTPTAASAPLPEASVSPVICTDLRLPESQYIPEIFPKKAICLHHTEGASAKSSFEFWTQTSDRIATAYILERDGTIYEVFDPRFWAWHLGSGKMLGVKGAQKINASVIGIELANEGALKPDDNGVLTCFGRKYEGRPWGFGCDDVVGETWRDGKVWAAYPHKQLSSLKVLLGHLCSQFDIPYKLVGGLDYRKEALYESGIYCHCTVREDKHDLHPGIRPFLKDNF
jgi:peptidoglycan hydrolase-like protein with peptidoglycan-binding domain